MFWASLFVNHVPSRQRGPSGAFALVVGSVNRYSALDSKPCGNRQPSDRRNAPRRLGAPHAEPGPLGESLGAGRGGADFEMNPGHPRQRCCVPQNCIEKLGRDALPTMVGSYVHTP